MMPPASRDRLCQLFGDRPLDRIRAAPARRSPTALPRDRSAPAGRPRAAACRRRGKISSPTPASAPAAGSHSGKVSAMSSASAKPSRASSIAGCSNSASVNLPEPYFSSASARPATVPGTPMPSAESRDFALSGLPSAPRKMSRVVARRRGLAIIDRDVLVALGRMDHHEAAAADVSRARIGHGHRKTGGDRRIDRIAATPQHVGADPRRDLLLRHHHAVFGGDGMDGVERRRRVDAAALLRGGRQARGDNQQDCRNDPASFRSQIKSSKFRRGLEPKWRQRIRKAVTTADAIWVPMPEAKRLLVMDRDIFGHGGDCYRMHALPI